mmetsp:Transcript_107502/g.229531  ORF Transcript_107502/g.229531 Transcript_107502/m.229531 type:complete len:505 (-) Transcript_107502:6-1520(-)
MHTALVAGWSSVMLLYELIIVDPTDPVYNPIWRQGCYVMPFTSRLSVVRSLYDWSLGIELSSSQANPYWTYETVSVAHILLSGFSILAAFWHWAYWDLDVFQAGSTGNLLLDLNRIFGIHLCLASLLSFGFGLGHLTGFGGPGMWTSDSFGLVGSPRFVKPVFSVISLAPFSYGVISSNHILAGFFGIFVAFWHVSSRPGPSLYGLLKMGNLEGVLSSSIAALFFIAGLVQAGMWYGGVSTPLELFGPSRYHWDNAYFSLDIERRVKSLDSVFLNKAWEQVPDKLMLYDYIASNPSKGGLFRSGPMLKADGLVQNWLGHASFEMGTLSLAVRRMPAFFEGFPVILIDAGGTLRADIPFRRASSSLSIEQTGVVLFFLGGILNATEYSRPSLVKSYARKALNGEIFTFDKKGPKRSATFEVQGKDAGVPAAGPTCDGVWRTSPRGWYSFSHATLSAVFFFGHLWHAARALFRDLWTGVSLASVDEVEYGRNEKLGDGTTKTSAFL